MPAATGLPARTGIALALTTLLALGASLVIPAPAQGSTGTGQCSGAHWVASWAAAPSDAVTIGDPNLDPALVLGRQSFRMIVTPHRGGTSIRVHLTNRFGHTTTTFNHVTVGEQANGAALVPGSVRQVTFGGKASVSVKAGEDAVSDPIPFAVTAFRPVAISYYVAGSALLPTEHFNANQASYFTAPLAGDKADAVAAAGYGNKITSWYFVDGLDVSAPASVGTLVAFGDSITDGFVTDMPTLVPASRVQNDANVRYPDLLQHRLDAAGIPLTTVDEGISGNRVLAAGAIPQFGPAAVNRIDADGASVPGVTNAIILEGINDLGIPPWPSATAMEAGYTKLIAALHAKGIHVLLGTIMPSGKAILDGPITAPFIERARQQVNAWIRAQHLSDGIVDFDAAMRDPANPSNLDPAYADGDNLHPNPAGYQAMANAVDLSRLEPSCP